MRERKKKEEEKTKRKEVGGCDGRNNDEEIFDSVVPTVSQKRHWQYCWQEYVIRGDKPREIRLIACSPRTLARGFANRVSQTSISGMGP